VAVANEKLRRLEALQPTGAGIDPEIRKQAILRRDRGHDGHVDASGHRARANEPHRLNEHGRMAVEHRADIHAGGRGRQDAIGHRLVGWRAWLTTLEAVVQRLSAWIEILNPAR
jgi:hypothetical protein